MNDVDVVIVGAGAAGLLGGKELVASGLRVVVLEARDRVGGRIWSEESSGWPAPVELGAEFIHTGNETLTQVLRAARVAKREIEEQHWLVGNGRSVSLPDAWDRIDAVMEKIGLRFRGSFSEWLEKRGADVPAVDRALARAFVKGFQGAPLERMSARTLFEASQEEEEQFRPSVRYDTIAMTLARQFAEKGGELRLGSVVSRIAWRRGAVSVETNEAVWRARVVLVTVPLGVLKARPGERGAIVFSPALKRKRRVLAQVETGHARRIVLRMKADVWRRGPIPTELRKRHGRAFGFLHSEEDFFPVWWAEAPEPILVGWTGGPAAEEMAGWSEVKVTRAALQTLAKLLGCPRAALEKQVIDARSHDWAGDPFTRGAYSFAVAGMERAPEELARPVAQTVFFAGEATADKLELGTVHGALATGARAAAEIKRALKATEMT